VSTKDWVEKDYYKVLGVSKTPSPDEIKKAFRKLARENHPTRTPDNAGREARFKEASEANSVLSDPEKRKEYDETAPVRRRVPLPRGRRPAATGTAGRVR
jgi:molecular chaperone DnaJ